MPWEAQRWSGGIAPLILNLCARWGWVVNDTPQPLYLRERDQVSIVEKTAGTPGQVWMSV